MKLIPCILLSSAFFLTACGGSNGGSAPDSIGNFAQVTPVDSMPMIGNAVYQGFAVDIPVDDTAQWKDILDPNKIKDKERADFSLVVKFGDKLVTGGVGDPSNNDWISFESANIHGNTFKKSNKDVEVEGTFYGPHAEQVAGYAKNKEEGKSFAKAFSGKQRGKY